MYKQLTAEDFRKFHGLAADYQVDGIFVVGTWDEGKELERLKRLLHDKSATINRLEDRFLSRGHEVLLNGKRIWFFVVYGGTLLSEYLHVGCMLGSRMNILSGVCGGLVPGGKVGDIILPTHSTSDGSTATMYDRSHQTLQPSNEELRASLASWLADNGVPSIRQGKTVTCQAMLAETAEDIAEWSGQGYLGVEMEASTVFALSNHFGVPSAAVLSIADNLIEEQTVLHENYEDTKAEREAVRDLQFRAAIHILSESI